MHVCGTRESTLTPGLEHDPERIDDGLDERGPVWAESSEPDVLMARQGMTLDVGAH